MDKILEKINNLESNDEKGILKVAFEQMKFCKTQKKEEEVEFFCNIFDMYYHKLGPDAKEIMNTMLHEVVIIEVE